MSKHQKYLDDNLQRIVQIFCIPGRLVIRRKREYTSAWKGSTRIHVRTYTRRTKKLQYHKIEPVITGTGRDPPLSRNHRKTLEFQRNCQRLYADNSIVHLQIRLGIARITCQSVWVRHNCCFTLTLIDLSTIVNIVKGRLREDCLPHPSKESRWVEVVWYKIVIAVSPGQ